MSSSNFGRSGNSSFSYRHYHNSHEWDYYNTNHRDNRKIQEINSLLNEIRHESTNKIINLEQDEPNTISHNESTTKSPLIRDSIQQDNIEPLTKSKINATSPLDLQQDFNFVQNSTLLNIQGATTSYVPGGQQMVSNFSTINNTTSPAYNQYSALNQAQVISPGQTYESHGRESRQINSTVQAILESNQVFDENMIYGNLSYLNQIAQNNRNPFDLSNDQNY